MIETMRWFGPDDPVSLRDIAQAGATGIVTALHHVPIDQVWPAADITTRRDEIAAAGLTWAVVESIPVHESIKLATKDAAHHTDIWIKSMRAVAAAGVKTICYNFMPVLDWTRTDLDHRLANDATALRFDYTAIAAFDIHILRRQAAENDYPADRVKAAKTHFDGLNDAATATLTKALIAGLPGKTGESYDLAGFRNAIDAYRNVSADNLLNNLITFQAAVAPVAETLGVRLAIHADDPPRPLLGMPRCVSTRSDFQQMFTATPSPANGMTWCLGSLSAATNETALAIGADHASRIHFAHLRVVTKDPGDVDSFQEAEHLGGDVSLIAAVDLLLAEESSTGRPIPMRPDHGHRMADDLSRNCNPGYSLYGRLKGLAELRGVAAALTYRAHSRAQKGI